MTRQSLLPSCPWRMRATMPRPAIARHLPALAATLLQRSGNLDLPGHRTAASIAHQHCGLVTAGSPAGNSARTGASLA